MIKLIASDIDGTLVNKAKELPPDMGEVMQALKNRHVTFAVASGRSLPALKDQFADYYDDIALICDNGALIIDRGEVLGASYIPIESVRRIIDVCEQNGMIPLLCTPSTTYLARGNAAYQREVALYYIDRQTMPDLRECAGEVTKIAVYQEKGIEQNGLEVLMREFGDDFNVALSGYYWTDIMNKGVSKGMGIELLQQRTGASYESTMAFGDYLNDIEMLEHAYYSFAMQNAHPTVKAACNFSTGSCEDHCVTKEIKHLLLNEVSESRKNA